MNLFDLLFAASFLASMAVLGSACLAVVRGKRAGALRMLRFLGVYWVAYLAVEGVLSVASPQRVLKPGQTRRYDDWCVSVLGARRVDSLEGAGPGPYLVVSIRFFSEARRVSQAAPGASVYLAGPGGDAYVDTEGQRAYEAAHGPQPSLGAMLQPLESVETVRVFRAPAGADHVDVATPHGGGLGFLILDDDTSILHKPTVFRVPLR